MYLQLRLTETVLVEETKPRLLLRTDPRIDGRGLGGLWYPTAVATTHCWCLGRPRSPAVMMLWVHFRHSQEGTTLAGDFLPCITLGMAPCSAPDPEDAAPTTLKECEPTGAPSPPSHPFTGKESQPGSPRKHPDLTKNELASSSHKCPGRSCQSQSLSLHCGSVPSAAVSTPGTLRW